jgi:hypothetical protein
MGRFPLQASIQGFSRAFQHEAQSLEGMFLMSLDFGDSVVDSVKYLCQVCREPRHDTEKELVIRRSVTYSRRLVGARVTPTYSWHVATEVRSPIKTLQVQMHKIP